MMLVAERPVMGLNCGAGIAPATCALLFEARAHRSATEGPLFKAYVGVDTDRV